MVAGPRRIPSIPLRALVYVALAVSCLASGCSLLAPTPEGASPESALRYHNIDNSPFATVASGPMDVLFLSEEASSKAGARGVISERHEGVRSLHEFLISVGARRGDVPPLLARRVIHTRGDEMLLPNRAAVRQGAPVGGGALTFTYEGWPTAQQAELESFVARIYPLCVQVYGAPAFTNEVKIIYDATVSGLEGGVYDATLNQIRIPSLTDNTQANQFMVIRQLLFAFHDDAAFYYEQWEQGFAVAAADVILHQFDPTYDPSYGPLYVTNLYELLNRPGLGHDRIFGTGYDGMLTWRLGMASGAFSKCWVEDSAFFAKFNTAYYEAWASDADMAGNVPALTAIGSRVLPSVEGTSFYDWFRRQHALDTSVNLGDRLYVYNLPQENSIIVVLDYFTVTADGRERPRGGTVELEFWDYTNQFSLFVQEGYEAVIPGVGGDAGQGFYIGSLYNIGGAQRLTVTLKLGAILQTITYPYMVRGPDTGGNSFLGAIVGRDTGTIRLSIAGAQAEELSVSQGSFGAEVGGGESYPAKWVFEFEDDAGNTATRQVNVGFFFYAVTPQVLQRTTLEHTFLVGSNGLHMMSVPGYPIASDDATVLGLDPLRVLLATWNPQRSAENKYEVYPHTPPIIPGRGFWLKVDQSQSLSFPADVLPDESEYSIMLMPGWNLVGSPSRRPIPLDQVGFDDGSGPVGFAQAVQNGLVRSSVYEYTQFDGYRDATSLQPWSALWIRCIKAGGCRMIVPIGVAQASARMAAANNGLPEPAVALRLTASIGGAAPASVIIGIDPAAHEGLDPALDGDEPPAAPGQAVSLVSLGPAGRLARDIRALAPEQRFPLALEVTEPCPVTFVAEWLHSSGGPYDLALVDAHGAEQPLRTEAPLVLGGGSGRYELVMRVVRR